MRARSPGAWSGIDRLIGGTSASCVRPVALLPPQRRGRSRPAHTHASGVCGTRVSRSGSVQNPPSESRDQERFSGRAWREMVPCRAGRSALFSPSVRGWRRRRLVPERITVLSVRPRDDEDDEEELFWRTEAEPPASGPAPRPNTHTPPPFLQKASARLKGDSGLKPVRWKSVSRNVGAPQPDSSSSSQLPFPV